jgi:hypothetical protein
MFKLGGSPVLKLNDLFVSYCLLVVLYLINDDLMPRLAFN